MEKKFQLTNNGQQIITEDFNLLGETSGLADDRVFAELFRLAGSPDAGTTVYKGILPYAAADPNITDESLVMPNGATGRVKVNPFRALVGARNDYHTDPKKNWRDIRSAIAVGAATLSQTVVFGAASGNPRWDLICAVVSVDANGPSVTRKVKNPTTKVIAGATVVTYLQTTVTLTVVAGTASATPVMPSVPADTGSTYYIPIAYVCIQTSYNGTFTFGANHIATVAPCMSLATSTGAASVEVANQQYLKDGTVVDAAHQPLWAGSGGAGTNKPPRAYLPPTLAGQKSLLVALDLSDASTGNHSHVNTNVVDSRDWRGRLCFWTCVLHDDAGATPWPWEDGVSSTSSLIAFNGEAMYDPTDASANHQVIGQGQSIIKNFNGTVADCSRIAEINPTLAVTSATVALYVDHSDGGKLKLYTSGNARARLFFKLDFSPPWGPRTHV